MSIRQIITLVFVVLLSMSSYSQYMTSRKNRELVDYKRYQQGGWLVSPGLTYMYPNRIKYLADSTKDPVKYTNDPDVNAN